MKKLLLSIVFIYLSFQTSKAQIQSPSEFLGYVLGSTYTAHYRVVEYFKYVAANSNKVKLSEYGKTNEGRTLLAAFVSSAENIQNLEQIRKNNLISTGLDKGTKQGKEVPFVWLSYNIHGDEASGTEAAMATLYKLVSDNAPPTKDWLDNVLVVIDPCENPDGRDRYANWYRQVRGNSPDASVESWEHNQPWPGGRYNHYLFDLNRDWAWQTQVESQQRIKIYQQWMPHIHIDLHEMGYTSPYFFAPAAKPFHENMTQWQRDFQQYLGETNAKYFDKNNELYFTKEVFDLFYPSYGDTWPTFNGAMGYTYEQGGNAGVKILRASEDTLTLWNRLNNHYNASLATIETAFTQREKLVKEFEKYFKDAATNPKGTYKSFVIKQSNSKEKIKALLDLLDKQQITYAYPAASGGGFTGFDYQKNKDNTFKLEKEDIVVSAYQQQAIFVKVLFEPKSQLEDSLTYDLTAWALPYIYGLEVYAVKEKIGLSDKKVEFKFENNPNTPEKPYAYLATWEDFKDVQFLAALLQKNIKARYSELPFTLKDKKYKRGTLIITRSDNRNLGDDFDKQVLAIANKMQKSLSPTTTGLVSEGKDFGSGYNNLIEKPKIALLGGEDTYPTAMGEIWHHLEQQLNYPVSIIYKNEVNNIDLKGFDVLILCAGFYQDISEKLFSFVSGGGRLIAIENAIDIFAKDNRTVLNKTFVKLEEEEKKKTTALDTLWNNEKILRKYADRERSELSEGIAGAIYQVSLDETHPLAFGEDDTFYLMKRNDKVYPFLPKGAWNVGTLKKNSLISGFVGSKLKEKINNTLAIGVESYGQGKLIYFSDSPIFRGFWHSGKLLFGNALFLVK